VTTQAEETKAAEFGQARLRKEDERLITGQTNWTDNIKLPGMLHVAFLRSPLAHARIASVDLSAAREELGVIAVYSGADFAGEQDQRLLSFLHGKDRKCVSVPRNRRMEFPVRSTRSSISVFRVSNVIG